jgi:signal transduction histidine kinase
MHLARELHDELGQYLDAIKLDAVSICESGVGLDELGLVATIEHCIDH